jgi:hypothetical protein
LRLIAFFLPSRFNEFSSSCDAKLTLSRFGGLEGRFSLSQRELNNQSGSNVVFDKDDLVEVLEAGSGRVVVRKGGFDEIRTILEVTFAI